jgi:2,4-dienoyl-CoA reductase-like NADH-dependent reductase (Old Yellow Enzyme family)
VQCTHGRDAELRGSLECRARRITSLEGCGNFLGVPDLFAPFTLGHLTLRNRLVFAPCTTYSSFDATSGLHAGGPDGHIAPAELRYLERRAAQVGLVVTAACYTTRDGKGFTGQWGCDADDKLPSLEAAASAIRRGGAVSFLQIHDAGRQSPSALIGKPARAPSSVSMPREGAETPRAMTEADIEAAIGAFADAATRARRAGFDGVEIHGANTYLLQQFLSPHSNRRLDAWGGSLENRLRFPLAVVRRVREVVGADFPVAYRYSPEETWEPGMTITDTSALLEALRGFNLAYISVSTGDYWQPGLRDPSDTTPRAVIAKNLMPDTSVMGVGKLWTRGDAERVLENGTDLVALGRALICDPEWTRHAQLNLEPRLGYDAEGWLENDVPPGLHRRILDAKGWFQILETARR